MRKVAIFGGTFDPVHWGHLLIAETALSELALDLVIWVPARCPPHKLHSCWLDFDLRWQLVQLATYDRPDFLLLPKEKQLIGSSYAIETLEDLRSLYPNTHWYWIIGSDAFQTLPKWYRRQEIVPACDWLVAPRPRCLTDFVGDRSASVDFLCQQVVQQLNSQCIEIRWQVLQMPSVEVSSSLIRQYCRQSRSIRYLVPEAVRTYLEAEQGIRPIV
ncbi:nicotinate (nicotinamide) nucleotide adenylyltransferase [Aerosakkonema funiforme]|uniref:Probable nicotinate-nucleotide adenylyltransferase n=1 Tax=Aerosakkonema funiforme FACHB-1375 TaxID=2949571 RepID=A0A926ZJI9_9CYAN|nr:nicotinate (nicotinamide) nucleotide adenylyltransferase [Aerosakkonema funiforme]MBD2185603.1 nicotinate (nicotinamide) nucleotide adenylyltransferase [Aerosakkonema funiforme FACHB-1375]